MMKGKGDSYQEKKEEHVSKYKEYLLEVKMGHFLHPQKETLTRNEKSQSWE